MGGRVMSVGCTTLRYTPYELLQRSVVTSYDGSYPRARAQSVDDAVLALRPPRDAHAAPVQDQRVREPRPLVARHERHQVPLDLRGVLLRSEEHTSELQSLAYLVCRLLLEKKKKPTHRTAPARQT